ncbi:MAG TPA: dihydrolipoyl dehydrogenase [Stellaceae bacterium]|nr:dihydrolipoyl dehydrogenase [Stellaceae bacterium]
MPDTFDIVIIGGGPGGYVAAIRAAQLGMKTACVESRAALGGTCLNIGCIPSKALLQSSEKYEEALHSLPAHGVKLAGVELDLAALMARKEKVVSDLTKGVEFLFRKNKVAWIKGKGRITAAGKIAVALNGNGGTLELEAKSIVIATGSDIVPLPGVEIDEKQIVSSTGALSLPRVPEHLVVIGGGYIGLEMGSVWRRLGAKVTVVEFLDRITPGMDAETSKMLQRVLAKSGFTFKLGTKVVGAKKSKAGVTLQLEPAAGGERTELGADVVLVAIGRRPYTDGLGLEELGVAKDNKGRVVVDAHYATNIPGIYAIGDVIAGPMLAHKAEDEGTVLVETLAGMRPHLDYDAIPAVIYTWPEVASVGKTEEELKSAGIAYKTGKFPFTANSRARTNATTDGYVKILADAATDRVLGVHIIGPDAGTMIAEAALAMEYGASAEDIARTTHAHPTLNEAVKEAALAVAGHPIHI